jgi:hypothetical protein
MSAAFQLVDATRLCEVEARVCEGRVAITPGSLERALGWKLQREGLCRGPVCVPVRDRAALLGRDGVDLAAFAELLGRPLALDAEEAAAALGTPAPERGAALALLEASDFTLPDLSGRLHALSEQRGKKVLLVAYASW